MEEAGEKNPSCFPVSEKLQKANGFIRNPVSFGMFTVGSAMSAWRFPAERKKWLFSKENGFAFAAKGVAFYFGFCADTEKL